jgi:hypothetical protein
MSISELRPSLAGLSLAPAPCYSVGGARAEGVRKHGFFGLLVWLCLAWLLGVLTPQNPYSDTVGV